MEPRSGYIMQLGPPYHPPTHPPPHQLEIRRLSFFFQCCAVSPPQLLSHPSSKYVRCPPQLIPDPSWSMIVNQLVSPSVALPAELVIYYQSIKEFSDKKGCCQTPVLVQSLRLGVNLVQHFLYQREREKGQYKPQPNLPKECTKLVRNYWYVLQSLSKTLSFQFTSFLL